MLKNVLKNTTLLIFIPIVFFLALEFTARIAWGLYSGNYKEKLLYGRNSVMSLFPEIDNYTKNNKKSTKGKNIYVLGGSTAYCTGVPKGKCWTDFLEKKLSSYKKGNNYFPAFNVINFGIPGGTSEQSKNTLLTRVVFDSKETNQLDYLIWYEGINDVYYLIEAKSYSTYKEGFSKKTPSFRERLLSYFLQKSAFAYIGFITKERIINIMFTTEGKKYQNELENKFKGLDRQKSIEMAAHLNINNFEQIKDLPRYRSFMFSIPLPKDFKDRNSDSHFDYEAKDQLFSILKEYCLKRDIPFGDVATIIESKEISKVFLNDKVHLSEYGNNLLAEEVFKFILPYLLKDIMVQSRN